MLDSSTHPAPAARPCEPVSLAALDSLACASPAISSQAFREALARAVTPVTVITTDGLQGLAGVTCSAVCSVCDTPPTVAVCINRRSYANAVIKANGVLCVNWLGSAQAELSQAFAGHGSLPMPERFALGRWERLQTGAPHCIDAAVALDCRIASVMEVGTHSIFLAEVVATRTAPACAPLAYCDRGYATTQSLRNN